jgi:hypothetical protein
MKKTVLGLAGGGIDTPAQRWGNGLIDPPSKIFHRRKKTFKLTILFFYE